MRFEVVGKRLLNIQDHRKDTRLFGKEAIEGMAADQKASRSAPSDMEYFGLETLVEFRAATEREFIRRKIEENGGNIKRTAERVQIQRSNLYKKLERYGLR